MYQWHQWILTEVAGIPLVYIDPYQEPFKLIFRPDPNGPFYFKINKNVKKFANDYDYKICHSNIFIKAKTFFQYSYRVFKMLGWKVKKKFLNK